MKEEQNNLEYKETMNVDVDNISQKTKTYGHQYVKLFMLYRVDSINACSK